MTDYEYERRIRQEAQIIALREEVKRERHNSFMNILMICLMVLFGGGDHHS